MADIFPPIFAFAPISTIWGVHGKQGNAELNGNDEYFFLTILKWPTFYGSFYIYPDFNNFWFILETVYEELNGDVVLINCCIIDQVSDSGSLEPLVIYIYVFEIYS